MITNKVEEALKTLEAGDGYEELTLDQFRSIYHKIINRKILNDHTVFAVFAEDRIFISFPEKPDVKFVITKEGVFFSKEDLNFIANLEPMGTYEGEHKFIVFLKKEFRLNWWKLINIFFLTFALFFIANNVDMLRKVNEMILASITIFISIFLLFVVSQRGYKSEFKLMKEGTLYKFFQNDKYIAMLAIFLIFLSIVTVAFSYVDLGGQKEQNHQIILLLSTLTSSSLVILAICYLAIYQYYFERMKLIRLLSASEELLDDRLQKYKRIRRNFEGSGEGLDH